MPVIEILNDESEVINTIAASEEYAEATYPGRWRVVETPEPPAPTAPEWGWYIDHGPFTDRLGAAATFAIDTSPDSAFAAIRADFSRRKWIDLKDPRVIAIAGYLAGQPMPGIGVLAAPLLTPEQATAVLDTPVAEYENLALRKLYFSS